MHQVKFLLIFTYLFSSSLFAEDRLLLKVALFDSRPFAYIEGAKVKGITKKLVDSILGREFDLHYIVLPYVRAIEQIDKGQADITVMYPNNKIQNKALGLGKTLGNDNLIISKAETPIKKLAQISDKRLTKIRGANYGGEFQLYNYKVIEVNDYGQSLKLLEKSRVDGIIISSSAWKYYQRELKIRPNEFNLLYVNFNQNVIFARKGLESKIMEKIRELNIELLKKYPDKRLDKLL